MPEPRSIKQGRTSRAAAALEEPKMNNHVCTDGLKNEAGQCHSKHSTRRHDNFVRGCLMCWIITAITACMYFNIASKPEPPPKKRNKKEYMASLLWNRKPKYFRKPFWPSSRRLPRPEPYMFTGIKHGGAATIALGCYRSGSRAALDRCQKVSLRCWWSTSWCKLVMEEVLVCIWRSVCSRKVWFAS